MKLTTQQRAQLFAGTYKPLTFDAKPDCEPGTIKVLSQSHPRATVDEDGQVFRPEREPMLSITVTKVTRNRQGGWTVRYDVNDRRQPKRLLRASPPATPTGQDVSLQSDEDAAEESAYTGSPKQALDHLEAVPRDYQKAISTNSREGFAAVRAQELQAREAKARLSSLRAELKRAIKEGKDVSGHLERIKALQVELREDEAA